MLQLKGLLDVQVQGKCSGKTFLMLVSVFPEEIIGDHQGGFRRNRSTIDHIFCFRQILEKKW
jgi:hypothetical protein